MNCMESPGCVEWFASPVLDCRIFMPAPETVAVAMNELEDEHAQDAIDRLIKKQKLDMLAWHKANNGGTNFTRRD